MKVKHNVYKTASIDDFYEDFNFIWARDAEERSVFDLWLHIVDHAAKIAKAVEQENPPGVIDDIADTTVWLMSFISFCNTLSKRDNNNLLEIGIPSDIIWTKYPSICPMCFDNWVIEKLNLTNSKSPLSDFNESFKSLESLLENDPDYLYLKPCNCIVHNSIKNKNSEVITILRTKLDILRLEYANHLKKNGKKLYRINELENMFSEIYMNYYQVLSLKTIVFNLLAEVGEASQAIVNLYTYDESREPFSQELLKRRKQRFSEKIADIFAWLFAASLKIRLTYGKISHLYYIALTKSNNWSEKIYELNFADIIWSKYGMTVDGANWDNLKCPGCKSAPCECPRDLKINLSMPNALTFNGKTQNFNDTDVNRNLIFISYSRKDNKWLDEILSMLTPLIRDKKISIWDDTRIQPGERWREEIESALSRAKIALLLVSANFLQSEFIAKNEIPPLLEAAEKGGTKILWVPISACMYSETKLVEYKAILDPQKPLDTINKPQRSKLLVEICNTIKKHSQDLL